MAGFLAAMAAGAAQGLGQGWMQEASDRRAEKLNMLDMEFRREEGEASRAVQREQIAATKENAAATLGLQRELGYANIDLDRERITSAKDIAEAQIASNEALQDKQNQVQLDLNIKPVTVKVKGADGTETQETRFMRGQEWVKSDAPDPNDPSKRISLAIDAEKDTPQISNYKYLMSLPGMKADEAKTLAFDVGMDPAKLKTDLYNAHLKARVGDFGEADDEDKAWALDQTNDVWEGFISTTGGSGGASSATETTQPLPIPEGETEDSMVAAAKAEVERGGSRIAAIRELAKYGITASEAGF